MCLRCQDIFIQFLSWFVSFPHISFPVHLSFPVHSCILPHIAIFLLPSLLILCELHPFLMVLMSHLKSTNVIYFLICPWYSYVFLSTIFWTFLHIHSILNILICPPCSQHSSSNNPHKAGIGNLAPPQLTCHNVRLSNITIFWLFSC